MPFFRFGAMLQAFRSSQVGPDQQSGAGRLTRTRPSCARLPLSALQAPTRPVARRSFQSCVKERSGECRWAESACAFCRGPQLAVYGARRHAARRIANARGLTTSLLSDTFPIGSRIERVIAQHDVVTCIHINCACLSRNVATPSHTRGALNCAQCNCTKQLATRQRTHCSIRF